MASDMNSKRFSHGMGVLTINGQDRLAVFGGNSDHTSYTLLDSVELYNTRTEKWEKTDIKLTEPKRSFGFLELKLTKNVRGNQKILKNQNPEVENWSM